MTIHSQLRFANVPRMSFVLAGKFLRAERRSTSQLHHLRQEGKPRLMAKRPCVCSSSWGDHTSDQTAPTPAHLNQLAKRRVRDREGRSRGLRAAPRHKESRHAFGSTDQVSREIVLVEVSQTWSDSSAAVRNEERPGRGHETKWIAFKGQSRRHPYVRTRLM